MHHITAEGTNGLQRKTHYHLNGFNQLSDPIIWIWTVVYIYQINWKNAANVCGCASEIFASYLLSLRLEACSNTSRLNSFISTFKGFAKSVSYLALRFSKLGAIFKKYLLHSGHTTSFQCHKTSIRQDVV